MKTKKKNFNQNINLGYLDKLNNLISENVCAFEKRKKIIQIDKRRYKYQYYNQLYTCLTRVRETSCYLQNFVFKQDNNHKEAFDFYEFITCISIVYGCTETIFLIFGLNISESLSGKIAFRKSNKTKENDIQFFKFIRSASTAHPSETTRHMKFTDKKFYTYPYAVWASVWPSDFLSKDNRDADIILKMYALKVYKKDLEYGLYISEFYCF